MEERRRLISLVRKQGWSVSAAARECGVSRPTAYLWLRRADELEEGGQSLEALHEHSRRPQRLREPTPLPLVESVLELKARRPHWGAKKLHHVLWGHLATPPVCVRTVDRILARHGCTQPTTPRPGQWQLFERPACNELWQMDYKGLEHVWGYKPLSLLDDHSRYCLALEPLQRFDVEALWQVLWRIFEEYGLPDCILSDNGDGFNCLASHSLTPLQSRLWRLGIDTTHGRPSHPQTQGKVERFHGTLEREWSQELRQNTLTQAQNTSALIRHDYNWQRPHEALEMQCPGQLYRPSQRVRPDQLPQAQVSDQGFARKVDSSGYISFEGQRYRAGRGLCGQWVEVQETEFGWMLFYNLRLLLKLNDVLVHRTQNQRTSPQRPASKV